MRSNCFKIACYMICVVFLEKENCLFLSNLLAIFFIYCNICSSAFGLNVALFFGASELTFVLYATWMCLVLIKQIFRNLKRSAFMSIHKAV